jgi:8-oxo-dGTP pyrophosphatase MutT (NUDIX family)
MSSETIVSSPSIYGVPVFSKDAAIVAQLPILVKAPKLRGYVASLDREFLTIIGLRIDGVKWFCNPAAPDPNKLGFLYMELLATDKRNGKPVPGVVFLRGDAVAIYLRVVIGCEKFVVLTRQLRAPVGDLFEEIPAGMMDDQNCFAGVAMKEIYEETGLIAPNIHALIPLGEPIVPSAGGCDERIQLFFWEMKITSELADKMKVKIYGAKDENESIKLVFVPVDEYEAKLMEMGDVKAICAHQRAMQKGLLRDTCIKVGGCCCIA